MIKQAFLGTYSPQRGSIKEKGTYDLSCHLNLGNHRVYRFAGQIKFDSLVVVVVVVIVVDPCKAPAFA